MTSIGYEQEITDGEQLSIYEVQNPPRVKLPVNGLYTVIMYDIDAPYPGNATRSPWLHWLIVNAQRSPFGPKGQLVASYQPPNPPKDSPAHRYIIQIFSQPEPIDVTKAKWIRGGANFDLKRFIKDYNLQPIYSVSFKADQYF
jgi:phosphatidylethanolamine-binding protein (PEBP) family uncharacterized protein